MSLLDSWTPEELAYFAEKQEMRRQIKRQKCHDYQARKHQQVLEKLGGKCSNCGETDPHLLHIEGHDKSVSWSPRYGAILRGDMTPPLLCAKCNWKKRKVLGQDTGRPRIN